MNTTIEEVSVIVRQEFHTGLARVNSTTEAMAINTLESKLQQCWEVRYEQCMEYIGKC